MAVTIDAPTLAGALGIDQATATRLLGVATALVEKYGANAPDAIDNEAVIRVAGYLHGQPKAAVRAESVGSLEAQYAPSRQSALRHSGAMALLSPYKVRRGGLVGTGPPTPEPRRAAPPAPAPVPSQSQPRNQGALSSLPRVRVLLIPFTVQDTPFPTISAWSGQQWLDATGAVTVLGVPRSAVSITAPVYARQMEFYLTGSGFQWLAVGVPFNTIPPTHFRLKEADDTADWGDRWRQAPGEGVTDGEAFDVWFFPVVQTTFPQTAIFEWPL